MERPTHRQCDNRQVPWASLGRAPVLVELDRLYLLAGPKEEFEESDHSLEQVCISSATKLPNNTRSAKAQHSSVNVDVCDSAQDFEEAEQQAKQQRVADAELAATQVKTACIYSSSNYLSTP